jgi:hypothetical protein
MSDYAQVATELVRALRCVHSLARSARCRRRCRKAPRPWEAAGPAEHGKRRYPRLHDIEWRGTLTAEKDVRQMSGIIVLRSTESYVPVRARAVCMLRAYDSSAFTTLGSSSMVAKSKSFEPSADRRTPTAVHIVPRVGADPTAYAVRRAQLPPAAPLARLTMVLWWYPSQLGTWRGYPAGSVSHPYLGQSLHAVPQP